MTRIPLVTALVVLAVAGKAQAQRPVLTQDVDEPGRSPYQQTVLFNQDTTSCPNQFYCVAAFNPVPAGKRLVVTYASAWFGVIVAADVSVTVGADGNLSGTYVDLPTPELAGSVGNIYSAASPITVYINAGSVPNVFIGASSIQTGNTARASITGFLISVP